MDFIYKKMIDLTVEEWLFTFFMMYGLLRFTLDVSSFITKRIDRWLDNE